MECFLTNDVIRDPFEWRTLIECFKGFPVYNERARSTARNWSGNKVSIEIPDVLTNCGVTTLEDRMNNKIFKVYTVVEVNGKDTRVYFDMYADAMLDLMLFGGIEKGEIKSELVFIERGKLVTKDGKLYKEYLEKEATKAKEAARKAISTKDLKFGYLYKSRPSSDWCCYMGKVPGGHLVLEMEWTSRKYPDKFCEYTPPLIKKSLSFKYESEKQIVTKDYVKSYLEEKIKLFPRVLEKVPDRMSSGDFIRRNNFAQGLKYLKDFIETVDN